MVSGAVRKVKSLRWQDARRILEQFKPIGLPVRVYLRKWDGDQQGDCSFKLDASGQRDHHVVIRMNNPRQAFRVFGHGGNVDNSSYIRSAMANEDTYSRWLFAYVDFGRILSSPNKAVPAVR